MASLIVNTVSSGADVHVPERMQARTGSSREDFAPLFGSVIVVVHLYKCPPGICSALTTAACLGVLNRR